MKFFILFNERNHSLLTGKSKEGIPKLLYSKRNMVQCKILYCIFETEDTPCTFCIFETEDTP